VLHVVASQVLYERSAVQMLLLLFSFPLNTFASCLATTGARLSPALRGLSRMLHSVWMLSVNQIFSEVRILRWAPRGVEMDAP
jgi:hypothetical protein